MWLKWEASLCILCLFLEQEIELIVNNFVMFVYGFIHFSQIVKIFLTFLSSGLPLVPVNTDKQSSRFCTTSF